ncbi:BolA family transcriptional regulator [Roseibium sp. RKSG952]|uniref:BolA family protein n=1 Tax=Roseibium sp. RKSG952 TaxID=2529384 RepID=UPI0012BBA9AE|nr:BolA family protein [Roseibium sp. RKSG952]MTH98097.1 BolA family transcriptional regulator [Roseibium sp. RKSG952]
MTVKATIESKLAARFQPSQLTVIDESDKHRGHGGWREGGETHFRVQIVSKAFEGMSRVNRHRAINETLSDELTTGVHALAIEVRSPEEPDPRAARIRSSNESKG